MIGKHTGRRWVRAEVVIAVAALLAGLLVSRAFAVEPPPSRKMSRQIDVMEKIIDQVLIDSPNFLVSGRGTTRGLYVTGYGTIFTFSASLVDKGQNWHFDFKDGFKIFDDDGRRIIVLDEDGDVIMDNEIEDDYEADEDDEDSDRGSRSWRDRGDRIQEKLYGRGKAEIVDVFLDYGDTITTLKDGDWVAVVAFLRDSNFFSEARISRLALRAKASDLRLYAAEKISEEEMVKRILEDEY